MFGFHPQRLWYVPNHVVHGASAAFAGLTGGNGDDVGAVCPGDLNSCAAYTAGGRVDTVTSAALGEKDSCDVMACPSHLRHPGAATHVKIIEHAWHLRRRLRSHRPRSHRHETEVDRGRGHIFGDANPAGWYTWQKIICMIPRNPVHV